jgi:hypothetical protein
MGTLGIDAHKRSHTVVVDENARKLGEHTVGPTTADHLRLLAWAANFGSARLWALRIAATAHADWSVICPAPASESLAYRPSCLRTAAMPPGRSANRTRSMPLPLLELHCASRTSRRPRRDGARGSAPAGPSRRPGRGTDPDHQRASLAPSRDRPLMGANGAGVDPPQAPCRRGGAARCCPRPGGATGT